MSQYSEEFKKAYQEGRTETREQIDLQKDREGITLDYSKKLTKRFVMPAAAIIGFIAFFVSLLTLHYNFFIDLLISIVCWWLSTMILGLAIVLIFKSRKR